MDPDFWHKRWETSSIGFHENEANSLLVRHFNKLALSSNSRIFLPLCGKTSAIAWLLSNGYRVAGAELSEKAIEQLFKTLSLKPEISQTEDLKLYSADNIDIFVGDIFHLTKIRLGSVDAIYDRAALVALPEEMRKKYSRHLQLITNRAPQLLISYEYDQDIMAGPPFSVSENEINQHYCDNYDLTLLESVPVPGGLKGKCPASENIWLLR